MDQKSILIIDDEPKFATFVGRVAAPLGYHVEVTTHGRAFQAAFRLQKPDFVVIDMVMPEIDGNELILWLVEQGYRGDLVIITGYSPDYAVNARLLAEYKGLRSVRTLSKPVSVGRLREALSAPLGAAGGSDLETGPPGAHVGDDSQSL
ncbi:MAG: response regulator [Rhodospirillales bacterium]|nr:response regulator [Rhodospirillales bacterium]